jgi:hypothetical protein
MDLVLFWIQSDAGLGIIISVPKDIQLSKDLFHQIPGAQNASLHPELPQRVLKVNSCNSAGFSLHGSRWQMPLLFSHQQ